MEIAIVFGGESVEHEISVITALQAYEGLKEIHSVKNVYFSKNGNFYIGDSLNNIENFKDIDSLLKNLTKINFVNENGEVFLKESKRFGKKYKVDLAFLALHGTKGEDGSIQGFFDCINLPYTGSSHFGSAIGQDKAFTKDVLKSKNINVLDYVVVYDNQQLEEVKEMIKHLEYPIIIKPNTLGSSVGINFCDTETELEEKLLDSFKYDTRLIIEKCERDFREVNCAILGDYSEITISELEDVTNDNNYLSFEDKYLSDSKSKGMAVSGRQIPAIVSDNVKKQIHSMCEKAFKALNLSGVVRFDLMVIDEKVYITEVNTIPGSLAFYLFTPLGITNINLYEKLISLAIKKVRVEKSKIKSYDTNVLSIKKLKGSKHGK